jgi:S1-C subfamily serine protease
MDACAEPVSSPSPPRFHAVRFLCVAFLIVSIGAVAILLTPEVMLRWWSMRARADADATYLRRQAELRAEAEAADARLGQLDERFRLVSLGFREVAQKVAPCVVNVTNEAEVAEPSRQRFFYDYKNRRTYEEKAEGSGVIVRPGVVLTNDHVVKGAQRLRVTFASGEWVTIEPTSVAADPLTDLAVIRLPAAKAGSSLEQAQASVASFADSDRDAQVGDWVLASGSPFGLQQTVTAGILSAKGRVELGILDQVELLQTDAAINPGNSGGPLFDQQGRVLGINVAIASKNGVNQGVGFAIPANTAKAIVEELLEHGEVVRGFLGIGLQEIPKDLESRVGAAETGGVLVSLVRTGSPADIAGLRSGDIILRFEGEPVGSRNAVNRLRQHIARTAPQTTVPVEVLRGKRRVMLDVTVTKRQ